MTPTHVYQPGPGSQMMMIPGQQLPFQSSPQGPAYFIPGQVDWHPCTCCLIVLWFSSTCDDPSVSPLMSRQYRSATYVATPQQYPVPAGTPGFYPGTSPADYGSYGKRLQPGDPHISYFKILFRQLQFII